MSHKCETCGSLVKIEGDTTKYYVPINPDKLTLENIDQQFCSDWLKNQIKLLFKELQITKRRMHVAQDFIAHVIEKKK